MTVVGARRRVDLVVPARASIAEYAPNLLLWCGQMEFDNTFPPAWSLALPGAAPFAPELSLAELGVLDGATLYLRDAAAGEYDEPRVTELEDVVAEANRTGFRWDERCRAYTMVGLGIAAMLAGFVALLRSSDQRPSVVFGTVLVGVGLAVLGRHAHQANWPLPVPMRVMVALGAVPMFAVAGAALPVADGLVQLAASICLGAMLGAAAALAAIRHVATLATLAVLMVAFPVVGLLLWLRAGPVQSAAVFAIVGLAGLSSAPAVSGKLAELTMPDSPETATVVDEAAVQAEIAHLVGLGRRLLALLNGCCALLLGTCVAVLGSVNAGPNQEFALGMAICVSLALLVRSGQVQALSTVLPVVAAGCFGLVAVVLSASAYLGGPDWVGPLVLLVVSVAAVVIGVTGAVGPAAVEDSPPKWLPRLSTVLMFASVMCAFGVFGVFALLMRLGEGV